MERFICSDNFPGRTLEMRRLAAGFEAWLSLSRKGASKLAHSKCVVMLGNKRNRRKH